MAQPTLYVRGLLLEELRKVRPHPTSAVTISYDATPTHLRGRNTNLLYSVDNGRYEAHQDEQRLIGETVPAFHTQPEGDLQVIPDPERNGVITRYSNGYTRHIQWLTRYGEQVAQLWKTGISPDALNTTLHKALTEKDLPDAYKQAVLTLLHLDQAQTALTPESVKELQTRLEQEPELGEALVSVAAGNNQLTIDELLQTCRTVLTP